MQTANPRGQRSSGQAALLRAWARRGVEQSRLAKGLGLPEVERAFLSVAKVSVDALIEAQRAERRP